MVFFRKGAKVITPFEAPQRSVKIKNVSYFFSSSGIGTGRVEDLKGNRTNYMLNLTQ